MPRVPLKLSRLPHRVPLITLPSDGVFRVFHVRFLDFDDFFEKLGKFYTRAIFLMSEHIRSVEIQYLQEFDSKCILNQYLGRGMSQPFKTND